MLSSLDRARMAPGAALRPSSRCRCAPSIASSRRPARPTGFDFLSIDVEGHEIEVLRGFDIARWRPQLILLENHVGDLTKHRYLKSAGYRIIRRHENNGWYVPREARRPARPVGPLGNLAQILSGAAVPLAAQCLSPAAQGPCVIKACA